jgi:tetratricopeptide (TPR) repeat protein
VTVSVIATWAAGEGLSAAFAGARHLLRVFFKQDSLGRLLVVLCADFGEESDLGIDAYLGWRQDERLATALNEVLAGERAGEPEDLQVLIELIVPHLVRTDEPDRLALATKIADAAVRAAPLAVEGGGESTQLLANRIDAGFHRLMDATIGSESPPPGDLAHALVAGPLSHIGATADVEAAESLVAEGEPLAAAGKLLEVARRLDQKQLHVAAESVSERAAYLLAEGGDRASAVDVLLGIAEARVDRGSRWAVESIARTLKPLVGEDRWIVEALVSRVAWPEQGALAVERLCAAAEASAERTDHGRWLAACVDLLSIHGDHRRVLDAAGDFVKKPLTSGSRFLIELERLEALEALGDEEKAETGWRELLRWVDRERDPASGGIAYERRGVICARREDVAGAEDAYRRAMAFWAQLPGYDEQVADAFLGMQHAYLINARTDLPDHELRPLAWQLRGNAETPAARADRLISEAMSSRLHDKLPDAMQGYWLAYAMQRRSGSLAGMVESLAALAELHAHAGEPAMAMSLYIAAGNGVKAAEMAGQVPPDVVADQLRLRVPRWERAAAYHVVATIGRTLPDSFVASCAQQIIEEAQGEPTGFLAPQPVFGARNALAAIALALPADHREAGFGQLRAQVERNTIDVMRSSTLALILATNAGLIDAVDDVVDLYIADPYNLHIDPGWIVEQARQRDHVRQRLRTEALKHHAGALEALAMADLIAGDEGLIAACTRAAEQTAGAATVTEETQEGRTSMSVSMGAGFEGPGMSARYCAAETRGRLLARMVEVLNDVREPEMNRASAASALFNMAPALNADEAERVVVVIEPLAFGHYPLSQWDHNEDHPLSRWRFRMHTPHILRVAALGALAQLVAKHPALGAERLQEAVATALRDGPAIVVAAALDAASLVSEIELPFPLDTALAQSDSSLRVAAFQVWLARHDGLPEEPLLAALRSDPHVNVRLRVLELVAQRASGRQTVAWFADNDADAYVRAVARRRLMSYETTGPGDDAAADRAE